MENASKALLIAGSILIAIVLIAMTMRVLNSTQGTTDSVETTMQATEVAMFNKKFINYIGRDKTKQDVIELFNFIIINNSNNTNRKVAVTLYLKKGGTSKFSHPNMTEIAHLQNALLAVNTYVNETDRTTVRSSSGWGILADGSANFLPGFDDKGYLTNIYIEYNL